MLDIRFYNSKTKQIDPLNLLHDGKVRIYHCGPTVYKRQHIGNMRRFLFADFLRRSLEFLGLEVREITNITDVGHLTQDDIDAGQDKLAVEAQRQKTTPQEIAITQTKLFMSDLKLLNIQPSHKYPRASEHIDQMHEIIQKLLDTKHAYQTHSGIYFDVTTFKNYGALSGNTLKALQAGKRIAVRSDKHNPADFVLWIFDDKALQKWDSPWGIGYPGWHIECSAMSLAYLGTDIDIHTGGEDNKFPHHENELAQSESATDQPLARHWMHNAHLNMAGVKLAKREGEQLTLDSIIDKGFSPLAFRLFVFGSNYRQPLEFSWEALGSSQENLERLSQLVRRLHEITPPNGGTPENHVTQKFKIALADNLNTPTALAVFQDYVTNINKELDGSDFNEKSAQDAWATLIELDHVTGIIQPLLRNIESESIPPEIKKLAVAREQARTDKNFDEADRLRNEIETRGYILEDTPAGFRLVKSQKT
jgi:cysteinyl-tRNA synthetase